MLLNYEYLDLFEAGAVPNLRRLALLWGRILKLWRDTGSENSPKAGWAHILVCLRSVTIYVCYSNNYGSSPPPKNLLSKYPDKLYGHLPKGV